ncbi:MAG: EpsG family protein [Lachnospiraceae bacterium]|nr:EpsG family protein [Lachnospiraceae bacterium]
MILYVGLTILTVLLACAVNNRYEYSTEGKLDQKQSVLHCHGKIGRYMPRTRQQQMNMICMLTIFTILFLVSAGRYYVGNDYGEYVDSFAKIYLNRTVSSEMGFNGVVKFVQFLCGKDQFIPIFAVFSFGTVFFFMKAVYDQSDWFGYSFFLFMASGFYLSSLNTVRYYFALAIAMYAAKYMIQRDYARFLFWIVIAAFFHKTVLIVIPVYWFATRKWKKREMAAVLALCASLVLFKDFYRKLIFMIYPYYENTRFDTGNTSYINIAKGLCILVFALLYYKAAIKDNRQNMFYFYLNIASLLVYVFASFIPEVSRISFYFNAFQIFLIPNIIKRIEDQRQKRIFGIIIALAYVAYFAIFIHRAGGVELRIIPYATWIL